MTTNQHRFEQQPEQDEHAGDDTDDPEYGPHVHLPLTGRSRWPGVRRVRGPGAFPGSADTMPVGRLPVRPGRTGGPTRLGPAGHRRAT
uniref:Uncharacterized protein n=1 Tax=Micromonospora carbonacea TaxID=47853 RepID=A0A7D6C3V3_9ACTN|nr:hypothetical protein HZU44_12640 [Micromonospora carbonacea]